MLKKFGLVLLVGSFLLFAFSLLKEEKKEKEFVAENKETFKQVIEEKSEETTLFQEIKENFMSGCLESGNTTAQKCECAYNYLVSEYGSEKLLTFGILAQAGEYTDEMLEAMSKAVYFCQ